MSDGPLALGQMLDAAAARAALKITGRLSDMTIVGSP